MGNRQKSVDSMNYMISIGDKTLTYEAVSATQMVEDMEILGMTNKETKAFLWGQIVKYLKTHQWTYPEDVRGKYNGVEPKLYREILAAKCSSFFSLGTFEATYKGGIKSDQDILRQIAGKNPLNLEKAVLCQAVKDLNEIHRVHLRKSIEECQTKLATFSKKNIRFTSPADAKHLEDKLDKLIGYLREWDKLSTYTTDNQHVCSNGGCTNQLQTLHLLSKEISKTSKDCSSQISAIIKSSRNANIKERENSGEEVGLWEKTKVFAGWE